MSTPFQPGDPITADALNSLATSVEVAAGGQTITSTTPVDVTGLSAEVGANQYHVFCRLVLNATVGGDDASFRLTGPTASATYMTITSTAMLTGGASAVIGYSTSNGYNTGFLNTSALVNGDFYLVEIDALLTFSAAGTLALEAALATTAGDNYVIVVGSRMDVLQVL